MAKIKAKLGGLKVLQRELRKMQQFQEHRRAFHTEITNIWRDGAMAFVRAAMRQILVQTGMSAASFFPLARAIKRPEAAQAIREKLATRGKPRKGVPELPTGQRVSGFQGPAAGRRKGERAFIFSTGKTRQFRFRFSFQTTVFQHAIHEDKQQTISTGILAFRAAVEHQLGPRVQRLLDDWLRGRKLRPRLRDDDTGGILNIETESV